MHCRLQLLGLLLVVACGPQRPATPPSQGSSSLSAEIAAAEQAWARGVIAADTVALTRLLAPEFVLTGPNPADEGLPRAAWMTNVATRRVSTDSIAIDSLEVTGTADSAVARLHFWWRPVIGGQQLPADPNRLQDTWVRRDGRWQVVQRIRLDPPQPRP